MFSNCSDCCAPQDGEKGNKCSDCCEPGEGQYFQQGLVDRSRAMQVAENTQRQWMKIPTYQPIDVVTKTVEVPVTQTKEKRVPKVIIEEKIVEVPKYIYEKVEKVVEVPEVKIVEKIVEIPQYHYQYKYVPKIETKENIIQKPKVEIKYIEKIVEVPQVKEVVRYHDVETVEEVIKYVPKGEKIPEFWDVVKSQTLTSSIGGSETMKPASLQTPSMGFQPPTGTTIPGTPFLAYPGIDEASELEKMTRIEQIFKPKVVKNVEIQKHVPISVDVPVPYMVPKPLLVPVHVPVLKFRDHFVPVPVRRVVVPRIRWTNEVYEVECNREKPFLQVQDVIKPVPCDVEIHVHEFVDKAQPINPTELSQADVHAMWMRVNADLAEKKKEEMGENYPTVKHPPGTVFGEPGSEEQEGGDELADPEAPPEPTNEEKSTDPMALHPGHPLAMSYLQNQWMKKTTTDTHQMYTPGWFDSHQKALYNLTMQNPTQVQLSPEQAALYQPENPAFGDAQWMSQKAEAQKAEIIKKSGLNTCALSSCCVSGENLGDDA